MSGFQSNGAQDAPKGQAPMDKASMGKTSIVGGAMVPALRELWQRRGAAPLWPAAAVVLAHAWALGLWPAMPTPRHAEAPALKLRSIVLAEAAPFTATVKATVAPPTPALDPATAAEARPPLAAAPEKLPKSQPPMPPTPLRGPTEPGAAAPAALAPAPAPAPAPTPAALPDLRQPTEADRRQAAQTDAEGEPLPLYATRLPQPALLHYTLRYGALDGDATLHWRPQGERYALQLEGRVFGRPLIEQVSTGALADVGVAPERFTDRRRGRGGQAANFQREGGRVAFSGARVDMLLPPGAQDRLSVMVQLAAVAGAWPQAPAAGQAIVLWVVDARGYAGTWRFVVEGEETLALPFGAVQALRLQREPRHADDPGMTIWLDPAREWWPVRLRQGRVRGDFVYELKLSAIERER